MLAFAVLFLALFAIVAVNEGIGDPSLPAGAVAIVEDTPRGTQAISMEEFQRELHRAGVEAGQQETPKPGDSNYEELRDKVMTSLIISIWIEGQAEETGVSVSKYEVGEALHEYKSKFFSSDAKFQKYMKEEGLTLAVVKHGVMLNLLSAKIQQKVGYNLPEPSDEEVKDYYEEVKSTQFTTKPSRTVRLVVIANQDEAISVKGELEADDSPKSWKKVVDKYSKDPASLEKSGLFENITEETLERAEPLKGAIFSAPVKRVEGPLKTPAGYYVFEVMKSTPGKVEPLDDEAESEISNTLRQQAAEEVGPEFQKAFEDKWRPRSFCADGFVVEQCDNYKGKSRLSSALPTCLEPKYASSGCPAPVDQAKPALPGSVSLLEPSGKQLSQQPRPPGAVEEGKLPTAPPYWPGAPPASETSSSAKGP